MLMLLVPTTRGLDFWTTARWDTKYSNASSIPLDGRWEVLKYYAVL